MIFSELQDLCKEKFGIDHLADIARELGVTPQAVSNWKARNKVPYKYVLKIRKKLNDIGKVIDDQYNENIIQSNDFINKQNNPNVFKYEQDDISLTDIFLILARQLNIIILVPTVTCIITILYVLFISQPTYVSSAKVISSNASGGSNSSLSGLAAQFGINVASSQTGGQWIYPELIKSRIIAKKMLKRKFDSKKYGKQKSLLQLLTYKNSKPKGDTETLRLEGIKFFLNMVGISKNNESSIITISIESFEPLIARDIVTALLEEIEKHQKLYQNRKISETREFIEGRIVDVQKELNKAEEELKIFRSSNRRIENSPALKLEQERFSRDVIVLTGVFTTLKQQLENAKIEEVRDSENIIIIDPPDIPLQRSKPKRKQSVVLSGIFGLFIGCIIGVTKDYIEYNKENSDKLHKIKSLIINQIKNILTLKRKK